MAPLGRLKNGFGVIGRKVISLDLEQNLLVGSDLSKVGQVTVDGQRQGLDILSEIFAVADSRIYTRVTRMSVKNDIQRFSVERKHSSLKVCARVAL